MNIHTIPKVEDLPLDGGDYSECVNKPCWYVLKRLLTYGRGSVYAKWAHEENVGIWKLTEDTQFIFDPPCTATDILRVCDLAVFSSMLARLGDALAGNVYFGAATFQLQYEGEHAFDNRFFIVMSNLKEIGYWIKLQTIMNKLEPDAPTNARDIPKD